MKLLWLKEIIGDAYTEDMDAAACQAIGKDFVARADFNAKNTRVKELEAQVGQLEEAAKGHAKQLEELKKSAGDNEELTRKIGELEQQNKADKAAYEKELAIRLTQELAEAIVQEVMDRLAPAGTEAAQDGPADEPEGNDTTGTKEAPKGRKRKPNTD